MNIGEFTNKEVQFLAEKLGCGVEDVEEMILDGTLVYMRKHGDLEFLNSLEWLEI